MKQKPTERQAGRAARQLYYHRQHLQWGLCRVGANERISIEKLRPSYVCQQIVFHIEERSST